MWVRETCLLVVVVLRCLLARSMGVLSVLLCGGAAWFLVV